MDVKDLKNILLRLEELYAAGQATGAATDIAAVSSLLDGHDDKTVETFLDEVKLKLRPLSDIERVDLHVKRLLDAGLDQARFDANLSAIGHDRKVLKAMWFAIANEYRNRPSGGNYAFKYKNIEDARFRIRDAFIERFEAASKRGIIDKLTRWAS